MTFTDVSAKTGHLTAHDKRVILAILNAGATEAKTPRKNVKIEGNKVTITTNEKDSHGKPSKRSNSATFEAR